MSELLAVDLLASFLSPQLNSAPLYRWRTGGFLNQPAATSPVKSRAWWRTRLRAASRVLLNVPFASRLQPAEAILAAQECRCQEDPEPSRTCHPPPWQDRTPTAYRVRSGERHNVHRGNKEETPQRKRLLLASSVFWAPVGSWYASTREW